LQSGVAIATEAAKRSVKVYVHAGSGLDYAKKGDHVPPPFTF
jgi:hypothetical protein